MMSTVWVIEAYCDGWIPVFVPTPPNVESVAEVEAQAIRARVMKRTGKGLVLRVVQYERSENP